MATSFSCLTTSGYQIRRRCCTSPWNSPITRILLTKGGQYSDFRFFTTFWAARIRRLFPSLLFMVSVTFVVGSLFLFSVEMRSLSAHSLASLLYWQNYNLMSEIGYFDLEAIRKPFLHLWSLSVEEHFYIVWPILLFVAFRFKTTSRQLIYIISALFVISFVYLLWGQSSNLQHIFYDSLARFWELSIGAFLAIFAGAHLRNSTAGYAFLVLLAVLLMVPDGSIASALHKLAVCLTTALVIFLGFSAETPLGKLLAYVGKISYPLYLWHWPIFSFGFLLYGIDAASPFGMLVLIALAVLAAAISYAYVERIRYSQRGLKVCGAWFAGLILVLGLSFLGPFYAVRPFAWFMSDHALAFKRTDFTDAQCNRFVEEAIGAYQFDYCRANFIGAETTVALIGDSHAHALFPGMAKVAAEQGHNLLLLANSSCPPLLGFQWQEEIRSAPACQTAIAKMLEVVNQTPTIRKVVMTTRGPTYIHGEVEGRFTPQSVQKSLSKYTDQDIYNYEVWQQALARSFESLSDHIEEKYYILENPELDFAPEDAMPRPLVPYTKRSVDASLYDLRMQAYRQAVDQAAGDRFVVLDPKPILCDSQVCHYYDGKFLYADDDHLSVYGSEVVATGLKPHIFGSPN